MKGKLKDEKYHYITKERYINDVNGNNLHPNMGVVVVKNVSSSSATKIKKFGTSLYSRGEENCHKIKKCHSPLTMTSRNIVLW